MPPCSGVSRIEGAFASATWSCRTWNVSCHGTLYAGSSKHGNARRASIGWKNVYAYQSAPSRSAYSARLFVRSIGAANASSIASGPAGSSAPVVSPTKSSPPGITRAGFPASVARSIASSVAFSQTTRVGRTTCASIAIRPVARSRSGMTVSSSAYFTGRTSPGSRTAGAGGSGTGALAVLGGRSSGGGAGTAAGRDDEHAARATQPSTATRIAAEHTPGRARLRVGRLVGGLVHRLVHRLLGLVHRVVGLVHRVVRLVHRLARLAHRLARLVHRLLDRLLAG